MKYDVYANSCKIDIDESKKSTCLECGIHNAISKTGNRYYSRFEWFLRHLGLNFLDNHFKRYANQLSWEGSARGIPTTIVLKFPASINNCHAHVWWNK